MPESWNVVNGYRERGRGLTDITSDIIVKENAKIVIKLWWKIDFYIFPYSSHTESFE